MTRIGWAVRPLQRYADFSGRAPRAEFWWFLPFLVPVFIATWTGMIVAVGTSVSVDDPKFGAGSQPGTSGDLALGAGVIFLGLLWLGLIVPTVALQTRRLHDIDRSGWWIASFYLLSGGYILLLMGKVGFGLAGSTGSAGSDAITQGAFVLLLLLLIYSTALLYLFCQPGTNGPNRFGDDPYGANVEEVFA